MKKDKLKVLDEVWTHERIESFLEVKSHDGVATDFHALLKAYQSMRAEDFEIFIGLFNAEERDVNATNLQGQSVLNIVSQHRNSTRYGEILRSAGAN